ncbi:MAG: ATP-binding cassette domain-containing protein [Phaeovulum sp.]|uniref:ATP-binding cassette domain-containing protein n=1 Tax=Phaeovulum sp. TaxID=2934796 RepID=UPI002730A511|nr:ATP-binding cassette domain-containing protein [Phaeovulum sp.]MDP2061775.1 ATP-binding cassette domain-containing protein [Phaeovulum sp.]MDP3862509.1 ATP-binding cassette domain-containing protein [Phaeovulum sp.]
MSLQLTRVCVTAAQAPAPLFAPLTLTVEAGEIATVMGPSGIGKSTLLDAVGGHLAHGFVASGQITLNGRDMLRLPAEARRIGILFQDALMFPHLSVGDNLAFGLAQRLRGRAVRQAAVAEALAQAGLAGFADRDPATLSGGQRARAALMRALLAEPLALLLDEPFSKLDTSLRAEIRRFVFDHVRARAIPVLMVTHDAGDAEAAAGPVVGL